MNVNISRISRVNRLLLIAVWLLSCAFGNGLSIGDNSTQIFLIGQYHLLFQDDSNKLHEFEYDTIRKCFEDEEISKQIHQEIYQALKRESSLEAILSILAHSDNKDLLPFLEYVSDKSNYCTVTQQSLEEKEVILHLSISTNPKNARAAKNLAYQYEVMKPASIQHLAYQIYSHCANVTGDFGCLVHHGNY